MPLCAQAMLAVANDLLANPWRDCSAVHQAIYWQRKAARLIAEQETKACNRQARAARLISGDGAKRRGGGVSAIERTT